MSRTIAIIQARMGSTRLPGKVLMDIGDEPMLWHVYERVSRASLLDNIVIATSTESDDDEIVSFCESRNIDCVRGSENDVLDRYYRTASDRAADDIVRLTADCPLLSPAVIDRVVGEYERSRAQYVSNTINYTHPKGLDVEAFDYNTLEKTWVEADKPDEREHVTLYMKNSGVFDVRNVENVVDLSRYAFTDSVATLRWTVDYVEDLEFVREVYDHLTNGGHWVFDQQSVLELLEREPELVSINKHF